MVLTGGIEPGASPPVPTERPPTMNESQEEMLVLEGGFEPRPAARKVRTDLRATPGWKRVTELEQYESAQKNSAVSCIERTALLEITTRLEPAVLA